MHSQLFLSQDLQKLQSCKCGAVVGTVVSKLEGRRFNAQACAFSVWRFMQFNLVSSRVLTRVFQLGFSLGPTTLH